MRKFRYGKAISVCFIGLLSALSLSFGGEQKIEVCGTYKFKGYLKQKSDGLYIETYSVNSRPLLIKLEKLSPEMKENAEFVGHRPVAAEIQISKQDKAGMFGKLIQLELTSGFLFAKINDVKARTVSLSRKPCSENE